MKKLFIYLKPYVPKLLILGALYGVQATCALLLPYFMSNIVEDGIRQGSEGLKIIWIDGAVMLALTLVSLVTTIFTTKLNCSVMADFTVKLRLKMLKKVNALSFEQFNQIGTGSLITRSTDDIGWLEEAIPQLPNLIISVPVMFIGGVVLSFLADYVLALILLAASPVALFLASRITLGMEKRWRVGDEYFDKLNTVIRERLTGIRVIRAFDKDDYEHQRADAATKIMCNCFVKNNTLSGAIYPIASLCLNAATIAIIYFGAVRMGNASAVKAGDVIAILQYVALIANAVISLAWTMAFLPHVTVSMDRIDAVCSLSLDGEEVHVPRILEGSIKFENVSFTYPGSESPAVENASLDVKQGEIVAIIGGTGSGKSTIVKLIMDFYEKTDGNRLIGGLSYDTLSEKEVRDNLSIALQKTMIFEGSVLQNVKMGNKDATEEQVWEALEVAQIADFIKEQDDGLFYALSQSGSNISGGQKQRLNIARTILKDANVYIFDDSFSALDFLTEANLRKALNKHLEGKTQIIVTQRAATAMRCDKVYVVDGGKIVGEGSHEELIKSCPIYREIYASQLGGGVL